MNTEEFIESFSTRKGRWLANRLQLSGKGSVELANLLSGYAWNARAAQTVRRVQEMKGHDKSSNCYLLICKMLRKKIVSHHLYWHVRHKIAFW